jgi:S1-C subfamily serine protease
MNDRKRVYVIVGIIAAVGLLLSVILGAVAGGAAGYFVGRQQAREIAQAQPDVSSGWQQFIPEPVIPRSETPVLPQRTPFGRGPAQTLRLGALVTDVTAGTPAEQAGLLAGDVILAINDEEVTLTMDLAQIVQKYKPGDTAKVTFDRDGEVKTVDVTLAAHPDNPDRPLLGITYSSVSPSQ